MNRVISFAQSRADVARRIERVRIRLRGRGRAVETQRDLAKLLTAAQIEQAIFFRALRARLLQAAMEAFEVRGQMSDVGLPTSDFVLRVARLLVAARILGAIQVRRDADLPLATSHSSLATDLQFSELDQVGAARAVDYLRRLAPMTRQQWESTTADARQQAFRIAGVNQAKALSDMRDLIAESLEAGLTPRQFEQRARELLRNFETSAGRLRTIWNTNVGQALAQGRREELADPEVAAVVSWRLFDAMIDGFVRPNHAALEGALAPAAWWDSAGANLQPLLGFNCRCVLLGVTAARARHLLEQGAPYFNIAEQGIPLGAGPDAGFARAA